MSSDRRVKLTEDGDDKDRVVSLKLFKQACYIFIAVILMMGVSVFAGLKISENLIYDNQYQIHDNQVAACVRNNMSVEQINSSSESLRSLSNVVSNLLQQIKSTPQNEVFFHQAIKLTDNISRNIIVVAKTDCVKAYHFK